MHLKYIKFGLFSQGESEIASIGSNLITLAPYLASFLINTVIPKLGLAVAATAVMVILADLGLFTGTGGEGYSLTVAAQMILIIANTLWWINGVLSDLSDSDNIANQPNWIESFHF